MARSRLHLNEKELGTLYGYCKAPLMLHHALENFLWDDAVACHIHDVISAQGPDDALLSLSLSGLVMVDFIKERGYDVSAPLLTELRAESESIISTVGRLRIDMDLHGHEKDENEILELLEKVPDDLCVFASLYQDVCDELRASGSAENDFTKFVRLLAYQAEAQADLAWRYLDHQRSKPLATKPAKDLCLDTIPLPLELQAEPDSGKVIEFSLFRR